MPRTRRQIAATTRLSCEACTKRKVKCDKLIPCTNCQASGVLCVPVERRRRPRGRSRRPENWSTQAPLGLAGDSSGLSAQLPQSPDPSPLSRLSQPECNEPNVSEELGLPFTQPSSYLRREHGFASNRPIERAWDENLFLESACFNASELRERRQLAEIYLTQVDPILKILHRPSVEAHLLSGDSYLHYRLCHPAPTALASAIYYAASCALSPEKCVSDFGIEKRLLISKYQKNTKSALEDADYMITDDLTVLQAFVISLVRIVLGYSMQLLTGLLQMAMRCHDNTRRFWTMLALALRIAQALSLHDPNPPFSVTIFEREMRHRLWHAIGWLDIQASFSRASEPMIQSSWLNFQPFLNINDEDISHGSEIQIAPNKGVPETCLFHVLASAQETARYLTVSSSITPYTNDAHRRQELVFTFKQRAVNQFVGLQPEKVNFHWYLKELAHSIGVFLQLLAIRPPEKGAYAGNPRISGAGILRLAAEALDTRLKVYGNAKTQPWRWIHPLFFPWQALKIALSEIPICGNMRLVKSLWPVIEQGYGSFTTLANDSASSELLESMQDMMRAARECYDTTFPTSLMHGISGLSLPWDFSRQPMSSHQATCHSEDEPWIPSMSDILPQDMWPSRVGYQESDTYELNEVHIPSLGLGSPLGKTASASEINDILQTLQMSEQELFY